MIHISLLEQQVGVCCFICTFRYEDSVETFPKYPVKFSDSGDSTIFFKSNDHDVMDVLLSLLAAHFAFLDWLKACRNLPKVLLLLHHQHPHLH